MFALRTRLTFKSYVFIFQSLIQPLPCGSIGHMDRFRSEGIFLCHLIESSSSTSFSAPVSDSPPIFFRCHCLIFLYFCGYCQILQLTVINSDCINVIFLLFSPENKILGFGFSGLYISLILWCSYEKSRYKNV